MLQLLRIANVSNKITTEGRILANRGSISSQLVSLFRWMEDSLACFLYIQCAMHL